ncbi:MAG: ParA family protein [Lachnospiraceae bacterium]|nr:ParA family protein [Lachnospiraceae bacterium]
MLNYNNASIFQRAEADAPPSGNVIAVWGSPSAGKTTVSVKLAHYLASRKKNVILLLCDMVSPPLPCLCGPSDLIAEHSLGSILAATHVTQGIIKENCVFHKKYKYLTMLGMKKGENVFTYPPYTQVQAEELIRNIRMMADYVIIDCGSYIAFDVLSAVSLIESDHVLRLVTCNLKSISYLSSQLPLLQDKKWDADKQVRIVSDVRSNEAANYVEQIFGKISYTLPHCAEVETQALEGRLFQDLSQKESKEYKQGIEAIGKEVLGV